MDVHEPPAFLHKLLQLAGVCLRFEELPRQVGRPIPQSVSSQSRPRCPPSLPTPPLSHPLASQEESPDPPLQIGSCSGYVELTVKLKQNEAFPGPKVSVGAPGEGAACSLPECSAVLSSL